VRSHCPALGCSACSARAARRFRTSPPLTPSAPPSLRSTFSTASFVPASAGSEVDYNDPDFWLKLMPAANTVQPRTETRSRVYESGGMYESGGIDILHSTHHPLPAVPRAVLRGVQPGLLAPQTSCLASGVQLSLAARLRRSAQASAVEGAHEDLGAPRKRKGVERLGFKVLSGSGPTDLSAVGHALQGFWTWGAGCHAASRAAQ